MQLEFYEIGTRNDEELTFAVVSAIYQDKWVYVKHKERTTWEILDNVFEVVTGGFAVTLLYNVSK